GEAVRDHEPADALGGIGRVPPDEPRDATFVVEEVPERGHAALSAGDRHRAAVVGDLDEVQHAVVLALASGHDRRPYDRRQEGFGGAPATGRALALQAR